MFPNLTSRLCAPERQYEMLNSLIGYKYAPPMFEVLADDGTSEVQKAVLDLGTGAGNWWVSLVLTVNKPNPHVVTKDY